MQKIINLTITHLLQDQPLHVLTITTTKSVLGPPLIVRSRSENVGAGQQKIATQRDIPMLCMVCHTMQQCFIMFKKCSNGKNLKPGELICRITQFLPLIGRVTYVVVYGMQHHLEMIYHVQKVQQLTKSKLLVPLCSYPMSAINWLDSQCTAVIICWYQAQMVPPKLPPLFCFVISQWCQIFILS